MTGVYVCVCRRYFYDPKRLWPFLQNKKKIDRLLLKLHVVFYKYTHTEIRLLLMHQNATSRLNYFYANSSFVAFVLYIYLFYAAQLMLHDSCDTISIYRKHMYIKLNKKSSNGRGCVRAFTEPIGRWENKCRTARVVRARTKLLNYLCFLEVFSAHQILPCSRAPIYT